MNFKFVRKASYGVPVSQQAKTTSSGSTLGLERPGHKYIKREQIAPGKYRYIYEESQGKKTSSQDSKMMIQEFTAAMEQHPYWKRFSKYFNQTDFNNVAQIMASRGVDITPDSFVQELSNAQDMLGVKSSDYLPRASVAREYKNLFTMGGSRPSEYNGKLNEVTSKRQAERATAIDADLNYIKAAGFDEKQVEEFRKNPQKLREMMDRMQRTYDNFSRGGYSGD